MSIFDLLKPSKWKSERWLYDIEKSHNFINSDANEKSHEWHVVGESNYQKNIKKVAALTSTSETSANTAILRYENHNKHDEKAVVVIMEGYVVGYLSRDDARSFRKKIAKNMKMNLVDEKADSFVCKAKLIGGNTRKNGEQISYGVVLRLPFPE